MPLDVNERGSLSGYFGAGATTIRVSNALHLEIKAAILAGKHVVLNLYNAQHSELVLATAAQAVDLTVQRAFGGTTAWAWPFDACVCVKEIVPACANPDAIVDPLAGVTAVGCITIDRTNPNAPVIRLADNDVVAGDYCGLTVNACGLITHIPPDWPVNCLPTFQPCSTCGSGDSSGASVASQVTFLPPFGAGVVLGRDVQTALEQIDSQFQSLNTAPSYTPGSGISFSGTGAVRSINLTAVINPGTFGEFAVNAYGQITGYTPSATGQAHFVGTAPLNVAYTAANNTHTITIADATQSVAGIVRLASAGAASDPTNNTAALTAAVLDEALQANGYTITASEGVRVDNANLTYPFKLDFAGLQAKALLEPADKIAIWDTTAQKHKNVSPAVLTRDLGGVLASGKFTNAAASTFASLAQRNVTSIAYTSANTYEIVLSGGPTSNTYHVGVTLHGGLGFAQVDVISATLFRVVVVGVDGTSAFAGSAISFVVQATD
jgi:hypothetical protein